MKKVFLKIIRFYQIIISPILGKHCRFEPSCSKYCYSVIEKYGAGKGLWMGFKRILKCNPWCCGGIDEP